MPAADKLAAVRRDGNALLFSGGLRRAAIAGLWQQALAMLSGVDRLDLSAVAQVDSAGLAMLAELAARVDGSVSLIGDPPGLSGLRTAYRLAPNLGYAG